PTTDHDAYAKFTNQAQSIAGNPLCHASVSNWCQASGKAENSDERKDRCAKVSGDVAAKAIEMLNAYFDNKFAAAYKIPEEVERCRGCHVGKNTLAKMNCAPCHPNAHK
ncbi:MAG: split soret cytochrome c precursor, partial [Firmicutes bacterium]|nr:split soret cytochrome c precursor [Bacillota bacterium]